MIYRVKNWRTTFENNKSRERDRCSFVCVPNKQDGMGLAAILSRKDGAEIYGIWCLIIGTLSRQGKHRDGWLTDDGHSTGTPWALGARALLWRRTLAEVEKALAVLSSPEVGWIEIINSSQTPETKQVKNSARPVPVRCPSGALEENRKEYNTPEIGEPIPESLFFEDEGKKSRVTDDTKEPSKEGMDFANWFKTLIPDSIKLPAKWRENWAKVLDDMIRLDHRDKREIRDVCQWARSDEFWSKNFLSPKKLREKNKSGIQYFDVFKQAMESAKAKEKPKSIDLNDFSTYIR